YHTYDVPGLPRTDNATEQFYRQLKAGERRATGHRRSDGFVVRVGGFAAHAAAAEATPEARLPGQLARVPADRYHASRAELRANQERQTQMRRFHLRPDRYLADLERRWLSPEGNPCCHFYRRCFPPVVVTSACSRRNSRRPSDDRTTESGGAGAGIVPSSVRRLKAVIVPKCRSCWSG